MLSKLFLTKTHLSGEHVLVPGPEEALGAGTQLTRATSHRQPPVKLYILVLSSSWSTLAMEWRKGRKEKLKNAKEICKNLVQFNIFSINLIESLSRWSWEPVTDITTNKCKGRCC